MASGIFVILDDVAMLLDDAAVMSKIAAKKTAALLGDDLAVNAEKATGFSASRELPVIWAITKGSMLNKVIILPIAFLLSAFMPWLIVPILLLGGAYLSFEGAEKVYEWFVKPELEMIAAKETSSAKDVVALEKKKIKAAVRTDFILSIEIIIITLGTVIEQSFIIQVLVVSFIALLATVGVYGLVALLVRMDDTGLYFIEHSTSLAGFKARTMKRSGELLAAALPKVIRFLGFVGTIAMLLVGGGMYVHNIEILHHFLSGIPSIVSEMAVGLVIGMILVVVMHFVKAHKKPKSDALA